MCQLFALGCQWSVSDKVTRFVSVLDTGQCRSIYQHRQETDGIVLRYSQLLTSLIFFIATRTRVAQVNLLDSDVHEFSVYKSRG